MTTASGTREVPFARQSVWRALTALTAYCPVCDVSYVFSEGVGTDADAVMGKGTRFVCAQAPSSVEQERDGWVVHLRGEIDAPAVDRLGLQRRLEELAVVAIDVRGLTYIDSVAFPPLQRWAKRTSRAGGHAVIRGDNPYFDQMLGVMGLTSMFRRET